MSIADKTAMEIAQIFNDISNDKRYVIIPIGFPVSGKSMFLSSIMHYAFNGVDSPFTSTLKTQYPYESGHYAVDTMIAEMEKGKLYDRTKGGTMDLIGLDITPSYVKRPRIQTLFLDLAGEDLKKIKTSYGGKLPYFISSVLSGVEYAGQPIFLLITPYIPSATWTHQDEDALMRDFINYMKDVKPKLFNKSRFFVLVTKWDLNPDPVKETTESFIQDKRPQLYSQIKDMICSYGNYSVGNILTVEDDNGEILQHITDKDTRSPYRFWTALYETLTGVSMEKKSWF
ncbi:hypothetical protein H9Q08_17505 [Chryseobacterium sp. PS-8]|uniref:G domain-containing protein n=1 Tax=Chryseobacterium indicum TaxID=2766954 RepID=A0ABS9CCJ0_9FLAO|nr:hypothetical protein [Chryseobacterium sp. PS-8]MCF2221086.1 hypothetical protein [Chryseobacterium sp. PS-8]